MSEAHKVFILLREAGKILVFDEIVSLYHQNYDKERTRRMISRSLERALNLGMVWRPARECYQARPLMAIEEAWETEGVYDLELEEEDDEDED